MAPTTLRDAHKRFNLPTGTSIGLIVATLIVIATATFAYRSMRTNAAAAERVVRTLDVIERVQTLLEHVKDAETGQRGYLLTGTENYLMRYTTAQSSVPGEVGALRNLTADNPRQQARVATLAPLVEAKMSELRETVTLRRAGDLEAALAVVRTDRGKITMDGIRALVGDMQTDERRLLVERQNENEASVQDTFLVTITGAIGLLALIAMAAWLMARNHREREVETWVRAGVAGVADQMLGQKNVVQLCDRALGYLARYLDAPVAALHVFDADGLLHRVAAYGASSPIAATERALVPGEGLVGQVAKDNRSMHVRRLPDGYLPVASALGRGKPQELMIAPASIDGEVQAVAEFGFLRAVEPEDRELLARVSETIAVALRASRERERVAHLLVETQQQAEELQTQQEELRVSNEELEEQSHALKTSQAQLEGQQAELEQTNSQLEEQAQQLETQKDEMVRTAAGLADKAEELERSNRYKSEFLANMSHELRTPLNSTLILSKLLADNKQGNLTPEQVRFADTISSAGNDLLTLINDILDLSKIEAGKVEVLIEPVPVARIVDGLVRTFDPIAKDKRLGFTVTVEPGSAERIATDAQRLAQILRNLLSNAFKFTEKGQVGLRVFSGAPDTISMAVSDSGIGVAADEQKVIFEAFHQADGSTHRRYGGTGLGLSISRDLARLLGGDIVVHSQPGEGSVFTLTLPIDGAKPLKIVPAPALPTPNATAPVIVVAREPDSEPAPPSRHDDRHTLVPNARVILVIEDDKRFASILQDLAHEMGFQCIVAHSASEGISAATNYRPSAILLDMNLPDHSGLGVLDQLKRNPETRHIPVHVASVADYSQEARELGAVGYDLKPVARDKLVEAIEGLKVHFTQHLRRVLVIEDDARQLESIRHLLETDDVQIVGATRAADALAHLRSMTFDCMVMDLNLPDLSGYDLLEQLAAEEHLAFPPVIVYTGRTLTRAEEQRLNRYSRSIIIKDARSPERLLDEVTLFLHQVEADLPPERQRMLREARNRESSFEGRRVLVVEDDVRNVFALSSVLEPKGLKIEIARNGIEALAVLEKSKADTATSIDLVLMDIMMPEMDGYTAMREIRKDPQWKKLPIIALTAKAMRDDQEKCLAAGANDYVAKPLDVEKLLSLIRVWMPKA